tara:strand:- start:29743 stop:31188 length:1446 start_codon:yes stop_codon:yes gene_type:complete
MKKNLREIAKRVVKKVEIPDVHVSGISTDSQMIKPGELFIAIKGSKKDGHDYIQDAIKNGASAVILDSENIINIGVPFLRVRNTRKATSTIASEFYGRPSSKLVIIGITGTNGKTTTASILKNILLSEGKKTAQLGTLGVKVNGFSQPNSLTTPDAISLNTVFSKLIENNYSHVVMEVSSHSLDQYRVSGIDFKIGIFTNLTPEHLDYHGDMQSYFDAKAKLFKNLSRNSVAVINQSDPNGERLSHLTKAEKVFYYGGQNTGIHFEKFKLTTKGINGKIKIGKKYLQINSKLIGQFNLENILAAVAAANALGISKDSIESGVRSCSIIPGRMEKFSLSNGAIVLVDYAHTPDAYKKLFISLKSILIKDSDIYVVFGAGGERDSDKRSSMAEIVDKYAKHAFITPDNPRNENQSKIISDIKKGFKSSNYTVYNDRKKGLIAAILESNKNDIITVLGKGREEYQEINGNKLFYSDIKVIEEFQ